MLALGEENHGKLHGDPRLFGASDAPIQMTLPRKNHTSVTLSFRR